MKALTLLDAVAAVGASAAEVFEGDTVLDFGIITSAQFGAGDTATVELQFLTAGNQWVTFKTISLDQNSPVSQRWNESTTRGFESIRANVTAYAGNAKTITVTLNWRDANPRNVAVV